MLHPPSQEVLVVDDEANVHEWLTALLQSHRALVIAVESVAEALKTLEERTPTILISDIID
ncbi:hypothetical protein [Leptolyngbya sp. FACHB-17]|uniref:hypothetical protein n=1 Tax=unclassified Leptolyngbya TaxID=2650499 RepID=UPI0016811944|nr:hypothetical protein [Leptolyngbya sp. FACHB-17]MBD2079270.1 hypothetical protein [Leptolyngbya sp. FACHB-17]